MLLYCTGEAERRARNVVRGGAKGKDFRHVRQASGSLWLSLFGERT